MIEGYVLLMNKIHPFELNAQVKFSSQRNILENNANIEMFFQT